jgi:hypothetical protein
LFRAKLNRFPRTRDFLRPRLGKISLPVDRLRPLGEQGRFGAEKISKTASAVPYFMDLLLMNCKEWQKDELAY